MQKENGTVQLLTFKLDDQEYALKTANVVQVTRQNVRHEYPSIDRTIG